MQRLSVELPDADLPYLREGTEHFADYIEAVEWAQEYALANRELMMRAVIAAGRGSAGIPPFTTRSIAVNCHHNYGAREYHLGEDVLITRKGSLRAREDDLGIIPGSMGART